MTILQTFAVALAAFAALFGSISLFNWITRQAHAAIEVWAAEQDFTLLNKEMRMLRHGPFFFRTGKNQRVYYLTLLDKAGLQRHAFVRIGDFWGRMRTETIKVVWE